MSEFSSASVTMRVTLKKLERLRQNVGAGDGRSAHEVEIDEQRRIEEERKLASLSPFQRHEFLTARAIEELRHLMRSYQEIEDGASAKKNGGFEAVRRCRQQMRKQEGTLAKMSREVLRLGRSEKKDAEARELLKHVESARRYYRQRFGLVASGGDGAGSQSDAESSSALSAPNFFSSGGENMPLLGGSDQNFGRGSGDSVGPSLREDEEFQRYFAQVQRQDHIMDQQFDRIHAGILRLHDNAKAIHSELQIQDTLIDETEKKVDHATDKMQHLNQRLKKTIEQVDSSKVCLYLFCGIVVLGLIGGILYVTGVIKPGGSS